MHPERSFIALQNTFVFPNMEMQLFNQSNLPPSSVSLEKMYFCCVCPWPFVLYLNGLEKGFLTCWGCLETARLLGKGSLHCVSP